jgi:hypothetical protein
MGRNRRGRWVPAAVSSRMGVAFWTLATGISGFVGHRLTVERGSTFVPERGISRMAVFSRRTSEVWNSWLEKSGMSYPWLGLVTGSLHPFGFALPKGHSHRPTDGPDAASWPRQCRAESTGHHVADFRARLPVVKALRCASTPPRAGLAALTRARRANGWHLRDGQARPPDRSEQISDDSRRV